jgi:hypothetical protein
MADSRIMPGAPEHDYNMVHFMNKQPYEKGHCPPNCPYNIWRENLEKLQMRQLNDPRVSRHTETPDDYNTLAVVAARNFLEACCLTPTPDAIEQLVQVFLPCLEIMCERPWAPDGSTWRQSGIYGALTDARKKWDRFWERTWKHGKRHDDSVFDLINYAGFVLRSDPDSGWGNWGPPSIPEAERIELETDVAWEEAVASLPPVPFPDGGVYPSVWPLGSIGKPIVTGSHARALWPDGPPDPMTKENWRQLHVAIFGEREPTGEYPPPPPRGEWPNADPVRPHHRLPFPMPDIEEGPPAPPRWGEPGSIAPGSEDPDA